jgi:hypothetical protein
MKHEIPFSISSVASGSSLIASMTLSPVMPILEK